MHHDETTTSFAVRLAGFHTGGGLVPFLHDLGIQLAELTTRADRAIHTLADASGIPPDQLLRNATRRIGTRRYRLRDEEFSAEFLHSPRTVYCPACLSEDDRSAGPAAAVRRHRLAWTLSVVRTCPKHGIGIVTRNKQRWSDPLNELAVLVPERGPTLQALCDGRPARAPSDLQTYILERFEGTKGPTWLAEQSVEQIVRAAEMLGITLLHGPKPNLDRVSMDEWDAAGHIGFTYLERGPAGLEEGFRHIIEASLESPQAGPQFVFGRLYQWLQFGRNMKDPGPIRQHLRNFILDHFALPAGSMLFGEMLEQRRLHTVTSLSKQTGVNRKTVHKLLVACGLVEGTDDDAGAVFEAAEGERLAEVLKRLVGYKQLPSLLNYSRTRIDQLIEAGLIKPIDDRRPDPSQVRVTGYDRRELQDFLDRLVGIAVAVDQPSDHMVPIGEATTHGIKAVEIIQHMLAGRLGSVERLRSVPGISGLLVNAAEVRALSGNENDAPSLAQVRIRLGLDAETMQVVLGDAGHPAILNSIDVVMRKAAGRYRVIARAAIIAFESMYVSPRAIALETGKHVRTVSRVMEEQRVAALYQGEKSTAMIFLRSSVPWSELTDY